MKAFVTLLSNKNYLPGVLVLNYSLKKVKSMFPLYCILSKNVGSDVTDILNHYSIPYISLRDSVVGDKVSTNTRTDKWDFSNWNFTFDKLLIWGLTKFEKLVFLDSDMIVVKNIDHLFDRASMTASLAGVQFPTNKHLDYLNSGLMVVVPDKVIEQKMIALAGKVITDMEKQGKPLGDQDIINAFYTDWFSHKELILDDGYNLYAHYLQYYLRHAGYSLKNKGKDIYVIHYVGRIKPWMVDSFTKFCKMCVRMFPNLYYVGALLYYKKLQKKALKLEI